MALTTSSSDDYGALLRRLNAAATGGGGSNLTPARRLELLTQGGLPGLTAHPKPAPLPHMLNQVDSTLDGMIKRLEIELLHRPSGGSGGGTGLPPGQARGSAAHDPSLALSAQLRRVLAGSRVQVERDVLAGALRQAESELSTAAAHEQSLTAQLSVSRLLTDDLSSLGDQLRVAKNPLKHKDEQHASLA